MSAARLRKMLANIDAGKPINLNLFLGMIDKLNLRDRFTISDIESSKVKGDRYKIEHIKPSLVDALKAYAGSDDLDRISAATQNQSHSKKVIGSYLNVLRSAHESNAGAHPIFIKFDEYGNATYPPDTALMFESSQDLLIIENVQLFLFWQRTIAFLKGSCGFKSDSFDIVLGRGNEISNSNHKRYLSSYQTIYMCLDIDLGGLMIAKNLINLVPGTPYQFLMPNDIDYRLSNVVELIEPKTLNDIRFIGSHYAGLSKAAGIISDHTKTIEQESFLHV